VVYCLKQKLTDHTLLTSQHATYHITSDLTSAA